VQIVLACIANWGPLHSPLNALGAVAVQKVVGLCKVQVDMAQRVATDDYLLCFELSLETCHANAPVW